MPLAFCGIILGGFYQPRPRRTCRFTFGAVATGTVPPPAGSVIPPPGTFIVVCRRNLFSEDGTRFLPATTGAWGTSILEAPGAWGTVMTAERNKEAPLKEEEDIFGKLYKAGLGDERQRLSVKGVLRLQTEVSTGDEFKMLNVIWFVVSAQQIWTNGDWAEFNVSLVRWPTLKQRPAFSFATVA